MRVDKVGDNPAQKTSCPSPSTPSPQHAPVLETGLVPYVYQVLRPVFPVGPEFTHIANAEP